MDWVQLPKEGETEATCWENDNKISVFIKG